MNDHDLHRIALGEIIRQLREREGLVQLELADKLDVAQPTISRIEYGDAGTTAYMLGQIATTFGLTTGRLHDLTARVLEATKRAADAIGPNTLKRASTGAIRGLVRFVVALTVR